MVVFSLQKFINTFFYVQSSGRVRRAAPAGRPRRTASAGRRKRMATSPHGWRGGQRGRPPVAAANHHRTASPSTQRTAEKMDVRGGPWMPDVQTRNNLVWYN
jgi:hypothetical protein